MKLNFPEYAFRVEQHGESLKIFDSIRKKWVVLTPEEWVRQHAIAYLVQTKKYAASLIAIERSLEFNGLKKRFDVLVYNKLAQPYLLVECKAPEVSLSQDTLIQICTYNTQFKVPYLWVSNGLQHLLFGLTQHGRYEACQEFPELV